MCSCFRCQRIVREYVSFVPLAFPPRLCSQRRRQVCVAVRKDGGKEQKRMWERELALWTGLQQSFDCERSRGYENYMGERGPFAVFVASLLQNTDGPPGLEEKYMRLRARLSFEFSNRYETGSINERRQIVSDASHLANVAKEVASSGISRGMPRQLPGGDAREPNVSWLEMPHAELMGHPRYRAFLDTNASKFDVSPRLDHRYVRQKTPQWFKERENYVFTASTVWQALGFGEQKAAKVLGLRPSYVDHNHAKEVFFNARSDVPLKKELDKSSQVRIEWGMRHEVHVHHKLLEHNSALHITEAGLYPLDEDVVYSVLGERYEYLPSLAASPDSFLDFYNKNSGKWVSSGVAEIKCRCPFVWTGSYWILSKNIKAHKVILPMHYAQVQLQMMCCGDFLSAHVISHSIHGTNVFHVRRDENWLRLALKFLSRANKMFVIGGEDPPSEFFFDDPEYQQLLSLTKQGCSNAKLWWNLPEDDLEQWRKAQALI